MSENESAGTPPAARNDKAVRVVGIIVAVLGIVFLVAGLATYAVISSTLADEKITVSDDAARFAGKDVKGPFTAYAQADVIAKHAEEIGGGKTYSELAQDDPNRATVMNASFLRASLFTSVVAFGVAAFVAVVGVVLILLGWVLTRLAHRPLTTRRLVT
jgi:xanthosine utilization system XapX-like protein